MITATITNKVIDTTNIKNLSIAEDSIDTVRFTLAKAYEGTDLSAGTVYSLWSIPGGQGDMTELATSVDGDNLLIDWPLKEGVVSRKGMVEFQIVVLIGSALVYHTKIAHFFVDRKLAPATLTFTPDVLTAHLASVIAQRVLAETARDEAEAVLEDGDLQTVAEDLQLGEASLVKTVGANKPHIDAVAEKIADVSIVAAGIADIDRVEDIAADITAVALIADEVSAVSLIKDEVSAVADNATDIGIVATDLALGLASKIKIVSASIASVNTVAGLQTQVTALGAIVDEMLALYAIGSHIVAVSLIDDAVSALALLTTQITALGARTTEIDALYAQLDTIAAKANQTDMTAVEGRLETLEGTGEGSVAKSIDDAVTPIEARVTVLEGRKFGLYGFKKHKLTGACTPLYDSVALGPVPVIRGSRPAGFVNPYKSIRIFNWRSCLMDTKQRILAYYGQAGYDTPTHDSQSYEVEIPKAYIKQWEDESYTYRIMSESLAIEGMFVPGAFRDDLGQEMPFAYVDKYRRGVLNGYSVSRPDVLPEVNQNIIQFETKAEAIDDTMLWTGSPEELDWYITFVAEIMACNTNSQAAYGQGMSSMPYSASHTVVSVTTDANTVVVSNATANAFKVSMNVKLGSALGSGQTFGDRFIQSITDNGEGTSTVVVDGDPFTTVLGYVLHAHRQVTTKYEAQEIGEDCGFILHDGRPETQVENWVNGIAGHGGNVYEFSFGVLRYDNYVYLCHDRYQFKHNGDPRTNPAFVVSGFFEDSATYGWIKNMVLTGTPPYVMEWIDGLGASDITHYGDVAYYLNPSYRGTRVLLRRMNWNHGSNCGRRTVYGYYSLSNALWTVGWRASPSKLVK